VLFSEPKIPQFSSRYVAVFNGMSFSALQRAENSSITKRYSARLSMASLFQCSSASRKFLNSPASPPVAHPFPAVSVLFSEPKIPQFGVWLKRCATRTRFQCSSASRKFLNFRFGNVRPDQQFVFQCSSASRKFLNSSSTCRRRRRC